MKRTQITLTNDGQFLETVEHWLRSESEILVLIRYSRSAGSKSFEFFTSIDRLRERLEELPPETCVTMFRQRQLPLRGIVEDDFIDRCGRSIPEGQEFVIVETAPRTAGNQSWFHEEAGESLKQLRAALEALRGRSVAVGIYPPWREDSSDVVSAYVPYQDGRAAVGVY